LRARDCRAKERQNRNPGPCKECDQHEDSADRFFLLYWLWSLWFQLVGWRLVAYKASVEAEDWEAPAYQSRVDAGNERKKFETKRRRLDLSFNHHHEVAALPPPKPTRFSIRARNRSRRMAKSGLGHRGLRPHRNA
jgi:hypothetical protein